MYKIYRIVDNTNDNVYIGQTTRTLNQRLLHHRSTTSCSSVDIIKNGDYRIELIEETHDKSRERWWIENTDCCINKNIPGRTDKEWREDNKGHLANYNKEYREKNIEKVRRSQAASQKVWREKNKEKTKDYNKEYYKNRHLWMSSMGGRPDYNNMSLLKIDPDLFNQN